MDKAFEKIDTFSSVNQYLNASFDTSARKFLETFERKANDVQGLGLRQIEYDFINNNLRSLKLIGDETIKNPQIIELPEDAQRKYTSNIPAESKAIIDRYNDGFRIVYTPGSSLEDFLYANVEIINLMMGPTAQRIASSLYESNNKQFFQLLLNI